MRTSVKVVIGILVGLFLIGGGYFAMQKFSETPPVTPSGKSFENVLKEKVANQKEVSTENVRINFYSETENENVFAVGAYCSPDTSLAFIFDNELDKIKRYKVNYTATGHKLEAFNIAADTLAPTRNSYIVPYDFSTTDDNQSYIFNYYIRYHENISRWMGGSALVNLENYAVKWQTSIW